MNRKFGKTAADRTVDHEIAGMDYDSAHQRLVCLCRQVHFTSELALERFTNGLELRGIERQGGNTRPPDPRLGIGFQALVLALDIGHEIEPAVLHEQPDKIAALFIDLL